MDVQHNASVMRIVSDVAPCWEVLVAQANEKSVMTRHAGTITIYANYDTI